MGRRAIFWFDLVTPVALKISPKVANAHRSASQLPKSMLQYGFAPSVPVSGGVDVFERMLVGKQTLLLDQEGKYILEPGHYHSIYFPALDRDDEIDVAAARIRHGDYAMIMAHLRVCGSPSVDECVGRFLPGGLLL